MSNLKNKLSEMESILRDVVVVYILDGNGKVLLGERKKPGKMGLGKRVGIGGGIEKGESRENAVFREVIEEVGTNTNGEVVFELKSAKYFGTVNFLFPHKPYGERCQIFVSTEYVGIPIETKDIKPEWYDINDLPKEFMWQDNLLWVPKVLEGKKVNGIFLYDENNDVVDGEVDSWRE